MPKLEAAIIAHSAGRVEILGSAFACPSVGSIPGRSQAPLRGQGRDTR